ncbi:MAG TPA: phosphotransferase [Mycobacteriales bacterium]|nr:phosphotransferase [Mycobacteriales bacterium]
MSRATERHAVNPPDGKSFSTFERVTIDGDRYFLKRLSPATDWVMRVTGDKVHRPYVIWQTGLMHEAPECIDHTVVAMEVAGTGHDAVCSTLMRDVADHLVPEGDAVVSSSQHDSFIDHMAALSASFWGFTDPIDRLATMTNRLRFFDGDNVGRELAAPDPPGPIVAADVGWRALSDLSPILADLAAAVQAEPALLTEPLTRTPVTFLHGDWKMGNLGSHPDGRTILLDWAYPGSGPACWDLCWYLALNRARLPESTEASIARFRDALEHHGVTTADWFDRQLDLCLLAIMVTFGWEKALGDGAELLWWEERASVALSRQGIAIPRRAGS